MRLLLLMTIFIFSASASAGLYKWVDDDGQVHYSQKPPRGQQFKKLKAPPPAPAGAESPYKSETKGKTKTNAKSGNTVAAETAKNKKIREENCAKAKNELNNLQIHRRFRDKDGNVTVLSDSKRAALLNNAKKSIQNYCD